MRKKLKEFWEGIWEEPEETLGAIQKKIRFLTRLFIASFHKFLEDESLIRGATIGYAVVVSFVPLIIVVLLVGIHFIDLEKYFQIAQDFVRRNAIPIDLEPYFSLIREILENASGVIGGIGSLILFFSATSVLRNLEEALNKIWGVKVKRPFLQRIAGFLMVLILGPIVLVAGLSSAQSLIRQFSAPDIYRIKIFPERSIAVGENHLLLIREEKEKKWRYRSLVRKIDYALQETPVIFHLQERRMLTEKEKEALRSKWNYVDKGDIKGAGFVDIEQIGNRWWIVTDNGILIYSFDGGESWLARRFYQEEYRFLKPASFTRLYMMTPDEGLLLGKDGVLLKTYDGGRSWHLRNPPVKETWKDIERISEDTYIIVGSSFSSYITRDRGETWEEDTRITRFRKKGISLNAIHRYQNFLYIVGDGGTFLVSRDLGASWEKVSIGLYTKNLQDVFFISPTRGILIADGGEIRYFYARENFWKRVSSPVEEDLSSIAFHPKEKKFYITGNR